MVFRTRIGELKDLPASSDFVTAFFEFLSVPKRTTTGVQYPPTKMIDHNTGFKSLTRVSRANDHFEWGIILSGRKG